MSRLLGHVTRLLSGKPREVEYRGVRLPLVTDLSGRPRLVATPGRTQNKLFIVSMPKAGTYLVAAYVERLGAVFTGAHMSQWGFSDYRGRSLREATEDYLSFTIQLPLGDALTLLGPGQVSVGHLFHSDSNAALLREFRVYFLFREMRASLVSFMRFLMAKGRGQSRGAEWKAIADRRLRLERFLVLYGNDLMDTYKRVANWKTEPGVMAVRFESLLGDEGEDAQADLAAAIARHAGVDQSVQKSKKLLRQSLGSQTMTWSGGRSQLADYWTDDCERLFIEMGADAINRGLGYR